MRLTWGWTTEAAVFPVQSVCFSNRDFISCPRDVRNPSYIPGRAGNLSHFFENELSNGSPSSNRWITSGNRMRELLVTMTLLSLVSSEEFEPKKRREIPPEEDPNFWPTRGRRSYWSSPRLIGNLINRDLPQGPEVDYSGHSRSWPTENDFLTTPEVLGYSNSWRVHVCPRKKPISLVLPLQEYNPDETELPGCGGRCNGPIRGRGRRGDERWRRQQPLYAEEPGWIAIDFDRGVLGRSMGDEDPFIVARGKKRNEESSETRERRQLEDVIGSYDTDPFFVARGKRDTDLKGASQKVGPTYESNSANKFTSKPRMSRQSESEDDEKISPNSEEGQISENRKFVNILPRKKSEGHDKSTFLTTQGVGEDEGNRHRRPQRSSSASSSSSSSSASSSSSSSSYSSSGLFQGDDNKWVRNDLGHVSGGQTHDFSVKPRYSGPRDKHSNLQSILDEPFFVSRGKKNRADPGVGEYLRYEDRTGGDDLPIKIGEAGKEIWKNFYPDIISAPKTGAVYYDDDRDFKLLEKVFAAGPLRPSKDQAKPPRSRRGMLDDLLKGDDPFYVARGKRIYPEETGERYFDLTINGANEDDDSNSNEKLSLFFKATRAKLLQKLSDFSKIRNYPYQSGPRSWNMTNDVIN